MRLVNETGFPAVLQYADFDTDDRYAVIIWKVTYKLFPGGGVDFADDPMPLHGDPLATPFGTFHGDIFLRKQGVDLCVLGRLYRTTPVTQTWVGVQCGEFVHSMRVTGDRVWLPTADGGLAPSAPKPFTEMELGYTRAFGGTAKYLGAEAAHPDNPEGRGYALERADAEGKGLPNLEAARGPYVAAWTDQPTPVGWGPYPMSWGLRARAAVTVNAAQDAIESVSPSVYNNAHPDLVLPEIAPGTAVQVTGVYDQPIGFAVPRVTALASVRVGAETFEVPTRIDGVHVWLDAARVVVTQRANFRYVARPDEIRVATLTMVTE